MYPVHHSNHTTAICLFDSRGLGLVVEVGVPSVSHTVGASVARY